MAAHRVAIHSDRSNSLSAARIHLTTYIEYLTDYIKQLPAPVILVGHSFSGLIISGVAALIPDSIKQLIYIAAFIPQDKQSLLRLAEGFTSGSAGLPLQFDNASKSISLELPQGAELLFHDCANLPELTASLQAEPMAPFMEPVNLAFDIYQQIPCHFILCTEDQAVHIIDQRGMLPESAAKITELASGHSPFYAIPEQLVATLLDRA